jgi:hypothetical protein
VTPRRDPAGRDPRAADAARAARAARAADSLERIAARIAREGAAVPGVHRVLTSRPVALPGAAVATALVLVWAAPLSRFRLERRPPLIVAAHLPRWAFGRGGTTIGSVFLSRGARSARVLGHEAVHREQWRRYGLAFPLLYLAAGRDPCRNRFEREAGLEDGGYRCP